MQVRWIERLRGTRLAEEQLEQERKRYRTIGYEMSVTSSQVASVSDSLFVMLEENNAIAQALFSNAQGMLGYNEQARATLEETIAQVTNVLDVLDEVDATTDHLKMISAKTEKRIEKTLRHVGDVLVMFKEIDEGANQTSLYMQQLNQTSMEITQILNTVSQIARQTQLVALNASIESARAGEKGKCFGVVAEEIESLSQATNSAVKDIQKLVTNIHQALGSVNEHMDANKEKIKKSVENSSYVEQKLEHMGESFREVADAVTYITNLTHKEVVVAKQMSEQMQRVNAISLETGEGMLALYQDIEIQTTNFEQLQQMGDVLNQSSSNLSGVIHSYKLDDLEHINTDNVALYEERCKEIIYKLHQEEAFCNLDSKKHREALNEMKVNHDFIEAIWTNTARGKFICSLPEAGITNASGRDWFRASKEGQTYVSIPYISAISRRPCVTLSAPIYKDAKVCGVIGIDIKIEEL